jgi:twitching motility protein PilT
MLSESLVAVIAQKLVVNKNQDGRVPACEIMVANTAVKNLIRENKIYQIPTIIQSGGKEGMQSLDMDLQRLLNTGMINRNHAAEVANTPELFENAIL